jgi:hypothetical protein
MISLFASFSKFVVFFAAWLAILAVLVAYSNYIYTRLFGPTIVQVESVVVGGSDEAAENVAPYLVTRAKELSEPARLDALYEVQVPPLTNNFGTQDDLKFLSDLQIVIQGVEVRGLVRSFLGLFDLDRYTIAARLEKNTQSPSKALLVEWRKPSGEKQSWLVRVSPEADKYKPEETAIANKLLLDRAIYSLMYFMYFDPAGPTEWRKPVSTQRERFPNARALEAYYAGQQRLKAYLRSSQPEELVAAEREFRLLQQEMPLFTDGLMLLGLTLSEKRDEMEAISVYDRVEQRLRDSPPADFISKKTLFQARLFKAIAYRKLYQPEHLHQSIRELDELKTDIGAVLKGKIEAKDKFDFDKILATVLAEKATGLGYYQILLFHENFVKALVSPEAPDGVRQDGNDANRLNQIDQDADKSLAGWNARFAELLEQLRRIHKLHTDTLVVAEKALNDIKPPEDLSAELKAAWLEDKNKIVSVLRNAKGYARFRHAQVNDAYDPKSDDAAFLKHCHEALASLNEADAAQPNHYLVLQNLALIYGDPRFDPSGNYIPTAQRLFKRSVDIKQDDYFGHQNLALLAIRQIFSTGVEFAKPDWVNGGINSAEKSRDLRPNNWVALTTLAQLYALRWVQAPSDRKAADEELFEAAVAAAEQARANPLRILLVRLQWNFLRLRAATTEQFVDRKTKLLRHLHETREQAERYPTWEGRRLLQIETELTQSVQNADFDRRFGIRWPHQAPPRR